MAALKEKITEVKFAFKLSVYLLIVWGLYRFVFKLPEQVEETVIKPLLWLVPVFYLTFIKEKKGLESIGLTLKNIFPSVYLALGLGFVFVAESALINYYKYGGFNFAANIGENAFLTTFAISLVTAVTEEVTFRGYIFNRMWEGINSEIIANLITTAIWILIHIPIAIFVWELNFSASVLYLFLTGIFGAGSAFLFARTRNVISPILLHVLWEWPIILFR